MDSNSPAAIMGTTLFATLLSTGAGITAAKVYQRLSVDPAGGGEVRALSGKQIGVLFLYVLAAANLIALCVGLGSSISPWVVPAIVLVLLSWGFFAGVPVYEVFVEGAKDGFGVATKIIPYLVAILGAVGMLRGSGFIDVFVGILGPITTKVGMPAEVLPMALLRPLSGSGAYGVMTEIMSTQGPDTYAGVLVSTLQGSTETTFYVIAVYFGAVQVTKLRHAMAAALTADFIGIVGAVLGCQAYFWFNGL
jgi:spore maturation protein SpmB